MRRKITAISFVASVLILTHTVFATDRLVPSQYGTIQEAIDAASNEDAIIVESGTYVENINLRGKDITVTSIDPDEWSVVEQTIINGGGLGPAVTFAGTENASCTLAGFTITGGFTSGGGGGVYGNGTSAGIFNCIIKGNSAERGGAIFNLSSESIIDECVITNNFATIYGGGLAGCNGAITNCFIYGNLADFGGGFNNCNGEVINCTITSNIALSEGGGLRDCDGTITNCIIRGNMSIYEGGGLYGCNGTISNCIISDNSASSTGGMNKCRGSIVNCTIVGNKGGSDAGGLKDCDGTITNCIIWGNTPNQLLNSSQPTYSCIQDWTEGGTGNINDNPGFVSTSDYHLQFSSPCIDTGTNTPNGGLPAEDLDGNARPLDGDWDGIAMADMGAFESLPSEEPVIDLSATQFQFSAYEDGPNPEEQKLAVRNRGKGILVWQISEDCSWLEVSPATGSSTGEIDEVTLGVDISGLTGGNYSCELTVSAPGAVNSPMTVAVNLRIRGPVIALSASEFEFSALLDGENPEGQILAIHNNDGGTLDWQISEDCNWLQVSPTSGSSTGEINEVILSVDITGLTWGNHSCELTISAPETVNSPRTVAVNLHVLGPLIDLSSSEFEFWAFAGGENPEGQILAIHNNGGGTLNWQISKDCDWLEVNPGSGSSTGEVDEVILSVDETGLVRGTYNCELMISAEDAVNSPQTAELTLHVYGELHVPVKYSSIQRAIRAASDRDIVVVAPGRYVENINLRGKDITVTSVDPNDWNVVAATIIDGVRLGPVVTFSGTESASCKLTGFTLTGGNTTQRGGGICGNHTLAGVFNCIIKSNSASAGGGLADCDGSIDKCIIIGNSATINGGGLAGCRGAITNCAIYGNSASSGGGLRRCNGTITNCTIVYNTESLEEGGGGLRACNGAISNCIVWGNEPGQLYNSSQPIYSCIQDWAGGGTGNISDDPQLAFAGDYHLLAASACIDAGDNTAVPSWIVSDIDGNARFYDDPDAPDTGNGIGPIADMGAYEYNDQFPCIAVSDLAVEFSATPDGPNPEDQILSIRNSGPGTLRWEISESCSWLKAKPVRGKSKGEVDEIVLSADTTGLSFGTYICNLTVYADSAANSPRVVPVTLRLHIEGQLLVPAEYPTIQAAINAARQGESVIVADGTYTGDGNRDIDFKGKAITVRSENGPENCIIDCQGTRVDPHRGFYFHSGEGRNSMVDGFTITNGYIGGGDWHILNSRITNPDVGNYSSRTYRDYIGGGAIACIENSSPTISNCVIEDNTASGYESGGGGIFCGGASPMISNCIIKNNSAMDEGGGGGIMIYGSNSSPTVTNCIISGNTAGGGEYSGGGGISCGGDSSPIITNCIIKNNSVIGGSSWVGGGGVMIDGIYGENPNSTTISNCVISGNAAVSGGGGIYCRGRSPERSAITITNCTIENNSTVAYEGYYPMQDYRTRGGNGGGIYSERASMAITDCVIQGNSASGLEGEVTGGGIFGIESYLTIENCLIRNNSCPGGGGGIFSFEGDVTVVDCRIEGNSTQASGGGILSHQSSVTLSTSGIVKNLASQGGGLYNEHGSATVSDCIFVDNQAENWAGGILNQNDSSLAVTNSIFNGNKAASGAGLFCSLSSSAIITNCTLTQNIAAVRGGAVRCDGLSDMTISNSILWDNSSPIGPEIAVTKATEPSTVTVEYSDVQGGPDQVRVGLGCTLNWEPGNIDMEPGFAFADDWRLMADSPCIDAGTNNPAGTLPQTDLEGIARPQDGDGDTIAVADMGAFEYNDQLPRIAVSPTTDTIGLKSLNNESNPEEQILLIRNCGGQTLNWEISSDCDWLRITPDAGSSTGEINEVTITADVTGLGWGGHNCELTISCSDATNSPQTMAVMLIVGADIVVPWEFSTIQAAIDAAEDGDTIIVAPDRYRENINFGGKNVFLASIDPNDPDVAAATIIDGGGSGSVVAFAGTENASCTLAGFTITGGYSASSSGGIRGSDTLATIDSCIITGNTAEHNGGGLRGVQGKINRCKIFLNSAAVNGGGIARCHGSITNCIIRQNSADYGGGLGNCDAQISDCEILTNNAASRGGGLWGCDGNITGSVIKNNFAHDGGGLADCNGNIDKCIIAANSAAENGGGLAGCMGAITNCLISANSAFFGGGLRRCDGEINGCEIIGNIAYDTGGGLQRCNGTIINCVISANSARLGSGLFGCGGNIFNCVISNNTAEYSGAVENCHGNITNCTIVYNSASDESGGLGFCNGTITNCIIWGNVPGQLYNSSQPTFSCIQDWTEGGTGNINTDPFFVSTSDYHLQPSSPCVDAGTNSPAGELPETDLEGTPRPLDGDGNGTVVADMGAYEYWIPATPVIEVAPTKIKFVAFQDHLNPSSQPLSIRNWGQGTLLWELTVDCPWLEISPAIGISNGEWDEVTLSVDITGLTKGKYNCQLTATAIGATNSPRAVPVILRIHGKLFVPEEYPTIQSAIDAAVRHTLISVAPGTYYENVNFKGKNIILTSDDPYNPDIVAGTIIDGGGYGPVVTFSGTEPAGCNLSGFTITGGNTTQHGGGICGNHTLATISKCVIRNNSAHDGGGLADCDGKIDKCIIAANSAAENGGGLAGCNGAITNCLIYGNSASSGGGLRRCNGTITNCTIVYNTESLEEGGGGLRGCQGAITNCIIWGNAPGQLYNSSQPTYSCIQDWTEGRTGNIYADPIFVNAGIGNYRLLPGSPCIDAGRDTVVYEDIEGNPRPFDFPGVDNNAKLPDFDMGAYETVAMQTELTMLPRIINRKSRTRRILAIVKLPEHIGKADIDEGELLVVYPGGIPAIRQYVIESGRGRQSSVRIVAVFDKAELLEAWANNGNIKVTAIGRFISSEYFYGSDTVRIVGRRIILSRVE